MEDYALKKSIEHNCNYHIIIMNHVNGMFNEQMGSTYEFVTDSYFEKERPHAIQIIDTDSLKFAKENNL